MRPRLRASSGATGERPSLSARSQHATEGPRGHTMPPRSHASTHTERVRSNRTCDLDSVRPASPGRRASPAPAPDTSTRDHAISPRSPASAQANMCGQRDHVISAARPHLRERATAVAPPASHSNGGRDHTTPPRSHAPTQSEGVPSNRTCDLDVYRANAPRGRATYRRPQPAREITRSRRDHALPTTLTGAVDGIT